MCRLNEHAAVVWIRGGVALPGVGGVWSAVYLTETNNWWGEGRKLKWQSAVQTGDMQEASVHSCESAGRSSETNRIASKRQRRVGGV